MQSSSSKPILSFWQLWNMSFGFFGIQFGFALQNANTSRIFSTLGANPDDLSLFWLAAPVTGLLVQPIIGYLSDNTWHPTWGRRRPFFFIGAVLASIALFLMPNSSALWMAVAVLWLMDGAINVSMEPFRAFVGDKLGPSQQTAGFAMQTFFIGWGAVIASLLPTIFADLLGVSNVPVGGGIPDTVRYSFYCGGAIYMAAVMWTVLTAQELPPENLEAFRAEQRRSKGLVHALKEILGGFTKMPKTMVQLAAVQFFTWIALFAMWIYTTNAIGGLHPADLRAPHQPQVRAHDLPGDRRREPVQHLCHPRHQHAVPADDRRGHCVGQHPDHALRDPGGRAAGQAHGLLHGCV
jgi:maltose/moltooligosaccharide transporter